MLKLWWILATGLKPSIELLPKYKTKSYYSDTV
jgi:hypothetical protein